MEGKIIFIDRQTNNSEIKDNQVPLLKTEIPERKADIIDRDYKERGFERGSDGLFKRVNLNKLLGEDVKPEDKLDDFAIDGNTSAADVGGVGKNSNEKQIAFIKKYKNRQENRKVEIDN